MNGQKASTIPDKVRDIQRRLYAEPKSQPTRKSHVRENLKHGLMRRGWAGRTGENWGTADRKGR